MNLKMAEFLFEDQKDTKASAQAQSDPDQGQDNQSNSEQNNSEQNSEEKQGRADLKAQLDDLLIDGPEVEWSKVENVLAPNLAKVVFNLNQNLADNAKVQRSVAGKEEKDLSSKDKENIKKSSKVEKLPLGILDKTFLTRLFRQNISVGLQGDIGSKAHFNPVQIKRGTEQVEGAFAADFEIYKNYQMYFFLLSNENSQVIKCNGKAIVFAIPAFGADCSENLKLYSLLYPDVTKEKPVPNFTEKLAFFLLPFDKFDDLQTNPFATIRNALAKERNKEKKEVKTEEFIYNMGLSFLLNESSSISDSNSTAVGFLNLGDQSQTLSINRSFIEKKLKDDINKSIFVNTYANQHYYFKKGSDDNYWCVFYNSQSSDESKIEIEKLENLNDDFFTKITKETIRACKYDNRQLVLDSLDNHIDKEKKVKEDNRPVDKFLKDNEDSDESSTSADSSFDSSGEQNAELEVTVDQSDGSEQSQEVEAGDSSGDERSGERDEDVTSENEEEEDKKEYVSDKKIEIGHRSAPGIQFVAAAFVWGENNNKSNLSLIKDRLGDEDPDMAEDIFDYTKEYPKNEEFSIHNFTIGEKAELSNITNEEDFEEKLSAREKFDLLGLCYAGEKLPFNTTGKTRRAQGNEHFQSITLIVSLTRHFPTIFDQDIEGAAEVVMRLAALDPVDDEIVEALYKTLILDDDRIKKDFYKRVFDYKDNVDAERAEKDKEAREKEDAVRDSNIDEACRSVINSTYQKFLRANKKELEEAKEEKGEVQELDRESGTKAIQNIFTFAAGAGTVAAIGTASWAFLPYFLGSYLFSNEAENVIQGVVRSSKGAIRSFTGKNKAYVQEARKLGDNPFEGLSGEFTDYKELSKEEKKQLKKELKGEKDEGKLEKYFKEKIKNFKDDREQKKKDKKNLEQNIINKNDIRQYHLTSTAGRIEQDLKLLGFEGVSISKEADTLFEVLSEVSEEANRLEEAKRMKSLKFLLEDDNKKKRKSKLKEINLRDFEEVLAGSGIEIKDIIEEDEKVYDSFIAKVSGLLRKYFDVKIKGSIKEYSQSEEVKDHVETLVDDSAKKGQPASPIIKTYTDELSKSEHDPTRALGGALSDINNSGSNITKILVHLMLTNPEGFSKIADSFSGDKADAIDKMTKFISDAGNIPEERVQNAIVQSEEVSGESEESRKNKASSKNNDPRSYIPHTDDDIPITRDAAVDQNEYKEDVESSKKEFRKLRKERRLESAIKYILGSNSYDRQKNQTTKNPEILYNYYKNVIANDSKIKIFLRKLYIADLHLGNSNFTSIESIPKVPRRYQETIHSFLNSALQHNLLSLLNSQINDVDSDEEKKSFKKLLTSAIEFLHSNDLRDQFSSWLTEFIAHMKEYDDKASSSPDADDELRQSVLRKLRNIRQQNQSQDKSGREKSQQSSGDGERNLSREDIDSLLTSMKNESFIRGDLSSLLFEEVDIVSSNKKRNFKNKSNRIDLREEWLRIWDI